ncbi:MAG: DUF2459 domain-containing protein [Hyphomicrobiales bacterium]|nr:DUF2459 domain-containing protein [Hyphomicrobiales bacterium]
MNLARRLRRLAAAALLMLVLIAVTAMATGQPGSPDLFPPKPGEPATTVYVVASAYHSGLVLPVPELARAAEDLSRGEVVGVADRFKAYGFVEIGWGDEGFYRLVPTISELEIREAARALLRPDNPSVLHVVGLARSPSETLQGARILPITLTKRGFDRLVWRLGDSMALENGRPVELGPGLYGPSLFYRARGAFNIFNVCNHWVAKELNAAGLPILPLLDTIPAGLLVDLGRNVRPNTN